MLIHSFKLNFLLAIPLRAFDGSFLALCFMFNSFTKRLLDITAVVTKLAFVGNFLDQEGSENAVVAWKQSSSAFGAVCEGSSASLANDVASWTLGDWELPGDAETHGTLE